MEGVARALVLFLAVLTGAGGVGCGLLRGKSRPGDGGLVEDMRKGRRPMGQVVMVDGEKGFVLVQSPLAASAVPDGVLVVKAQGTAATTGRLKVTPERSRNRFAADVVDGSPKVGEVVFFETAEKVVSTAPPPAEAGVGALPAGAVAAEATGAAAGTLPDGASPVPGPGPEGGFPRELPPLGEPSGPREFIPDFPGLEPLPPDGVTPAGSEEGGVEPIDAIEPADPVAPSAS